MKSLSGIRVLDLGRVLAAPMCTQFLGDMGADVIKIERPGEGDDSRRYGPAFLRSADGRSVGSAMYLAANRNKRSITADLSKPEAQKIIRDLAARSDVLVENYKVGDLKRYGLDYESLAAVNPGLIYCSITGFGQTGPYSGRAGYDPIFQAMSGLMDLTGHPDGLPGGGPMQVGVAVVDVVASLFASTAILGALHAREQAGGVGQHIDIGLLDVALALMSTPAMMYFITGETPVRQGTARSGSVPSQVLPCADGYIYVVAGSDEQFRRFCIALNRSDLAEDQRFQHLKARLGNRDEFLRIITQVLSGFTVSQLNQALAKEGVPAAPVSTLEAAFTDPQVIHRQMTRDVPHPLAGTLRLLANPIRYSRTPIDTYTAPPAIGEHTDEILRTLLELDDEAVSNLRAIGAI